MILELKLVLEQKLVLEPKLVLELKSLENAADGFCVAGALIFVIYWF